MSYYAHSKKQDRPAQLYSDHIQGVVCKAGTNVKDLLRFCLTKNREIYKDIIKQAAFYHDLGKLNKANQAVLKGEKKKKNLPVEHRDAGVTHLLGSKKETPGATLVYAHHWPGLPNLPSASVSENPFRFAEAMDDTNQYLPDYLTLHSQLTDYLKINNQASEARLSSLEYRMLLSCLVDADYSDTAGANIPAPAPHWAERLVKLDSYVTDLGKDSVYSDLERNKQRRELYECCKDMPLNNNLEFCDSPVGTGKTTAVMARALKIANKRGLRHIIVVLPYTNIISQTVDVLRKAVVLDDEDPFRVVAEHHHQADFESMEYRHLATTWTAPIIVTTAVQFFETLASNNPAKLRKLHQLPGSYVIIDESHTALPTKLMPVAWKWLADLSNEWGCYICLCSGTSHKFWKNTEFRKLNAMEVPRVLTKELADKLEILERQRLTFNILNGNIPHFRRASALIKYLETYPGPRLVVLNTIQNAAYLAKTLRNKGKSVLHLSTALSPSDREKVIAGVIKRLEPTSAYSDDWTLVATSCVECGMDLSFRHGFCELRSLQSYLQLAGRVNRNREYKNSSLNCFTIIDDNFTINPCFETAQSVFKKLIEQGTLTSDTITNLISKAFAMECKQMGGISETISKADRRRDFADVAKQFKVIPEDTITVAVDPDIIKKLKSGVIITNQELQKGSVNMRYSLLGKLGVIIETELPYLTSDKYDDFLGYMKNI